MEELLERAYAGEAQGALAYQTDGSDRLRLAVLLRPDVPMGQLVAVAPVVCLGVLDGLESLGVDRRSVGIAWPQDVVWVEGHERVACVRTRAGYAEGMFVVAGIDLAVGGGEALAKALADAIVARVCAWAPQARSTQAKAGPWAPFLPEYFDRVALMGRPVDVRYPNGRLYARGHLVGIDIWGRATVRTSNAGDIEFPSEKFSIEPRGRG